MKRLVSALKIDATVQVRNKLYSIGIAVAALVAVAISQLTPPEELPWVIPSVLLLVAGGTTMLCVAGMILFEKDEGTLNALMVSPLKPVEYLISKVVTLTALATLEALVMIAGSLIIMSFSYDLYPPRYTVLIAGVVALGVVYTLAGIILIVRFDSITDFLIPMSSVAVVLQLPFLYLMGWIDLPLFLLIPTSAQGVLMRGAFVDLSAGEWAYAIVYTLGFIAWLSVWAFRAFKKHILLNIG